MVMTSTSLESLARTRLFERRLTMLLKLEIFVRMAIYLPKNEPGVRLNDPIIILDVENKFQNLKKRV
ncbi:hypothetical protein Hdeb2414_s0006g00198651 [Helianthus debilis subsp. tardiflorus]